MEKNNILNKYSISEATLKNWQKLGYISGINDIDESEIINVIKNKNNVRRNKRNSLDHIIPRSYVKDKKIPPIIDRIITLQSEYNVTNNEILIEAILSVLKGKDIPNDVYEILGIRSNNLTFIDAFKRINIIYNDDDDFLGCLYMSLLSKGRKDTKGIFYTPFKVVKKIIDSVDVYENIKILDPGCGSGNFLIQMYKKMKDNNFTNNEIINSLYGYDIDDIAILIAKINLYNLNQLDYDKFNVKKIDYLLEEIPNKFDLIIGNPPWGMKYTKKEKDILTEKYNKKFALQDSFSQFILKSFSILNDNGVLSFVLPSSLLNIATHKSTREFLLNYNINYIKSIGREFDEIVTDVIIIKVTKAKFDNNICIYNNKRINQSIFLNNPYFNLLLPSQTALEIIKKITVANSFHLNDTNSRFSLGIVTGNNKLYLSDHKKENLEPIISGKELTKYNFEYSNINKYINFSKDKFQQVAPESNYREPKIIYKFIGKKLCFSVENKGILTLNSANIINVIGLDIYYVSAILNSRITQLYFDEIYKTHKVLKNHIQSFYIFKFNDLDTNEIIALSKKTDSNKYNEQIEKIIYRNLHLTEDEIDYLLIKY